MKAVWKGTAGIWPCGPYSGSLEAVARGASSGQHQSRRVPGSEMVPEQVGAPCLVEGSVDSCVVRRVRWGLASRRSCLGTSGSCPSGLVRPLVVLEAADKPICSAAAAAAAGPRLHPRLHPRLLQLHHLDTRGVGYWS